MKNWWRNMLMTCPRCWWQMLQQNCHVIARFATIGKIICKMLPTSGFCHQHQNSVTNYMSPTWASDKSRLLLSWAVNTDRCSLYFCHFYKNKHFSDRDTVCSRIYRHAHPSYFPLTNQNAWNRLYFVFTSVCKYNDVSVHRPRVSITDHFWCSVPCAP